MTVNTAYKKLGKIKTQNKEIKMKTFGGSKTSNTLQNDECYSQLKE